jgi:putative heme iron utilization protein
MERIQAARRLFLQESFGVLSTISIDVAGYPFGSVTPYCVDEHCRPIIFIARIAQHTKNIVADSRVSLTVMEKTQDSDDVQTQGRVTYIADARLVKSEESRAGERYFRYFPESRQYDQTHDFEFFRLEPVRIRFIGGFGQIYWIEPGEFSLKNPFTAAQEARILDHMNKDHGEALRHYVDGLDATMIGIDGEGFDLATPKGKRRCSFDRPVRTMEEAREALVAMARSQAII